MTDDYDLSERAPTDDEGHPIHPERGHRICGAKKSDLTTPTNHGRERDEYEYCLLPAGWGTDTKYGACQRHPYNGSQIGEQNPNFTHGATSRYFKAKLSERQADVFDEVADALADPENALDVLRLTAARLIMVGEHAHDPAMVREGRQILETFNIVPNADELVMAGRVEHTHDHTLTREEKHRLDAMLATGEPVEVEVDEEAAPEP